jgi:hypothetical protein
MVMKQLKDYTDAWDLVCTKPADSVLDGGDTCANEFTLLYARYYKIKFLMADERVAIDHKLRAVYDKPSGLYVRHPDPNCWYSDINRFSRDQMRPLLYFLGLPIKHLGMKAHRRNLFKQHLKHLLLFTWNSKRNFQYETPEEHALKSTPDVKHNWASKMADFTGPETWATWVRVLRCRALWPALLVLDTQILITSIAKQFQFAAYKLGWVKKFKHDQRNHALGVHFANLVMPTPISWLAKLIYGKTLPQTAFKSFWSHPSEPPIDMYIGKLYK